MYKKRFFCTVILSIFVLASSTLYADEDPINDLVKNFMETMNKSDLKEKSEAVGSPDLNGDDWKARKLPAENITYEDFDLFRKAGLINEPEFNQILHEMRRYCTDEEIAAALHDFWDWDKAISDYNVACGESGTLEHILLLFHVLRIKYFPKWILLFEIGSERPSNRYDDYLYKIKSELELSGSGAHLLLLGRGSRSTGTRLQNRKLSKKRTMAVEQKLLDIGAPQGKIKRAAFGYEAPYLTSTMVDEYALWDPAINMGITPEDFSNGDWNQSVLVVLVK